MTGAILLNTLRMCLRQKAPWWLLLPIAAGGPFLSLALFRGDSTLTGLLRIHLGYVYIFATAFLMVLTVYLSATVLDTELTGKQAHTLCVKPIARWRILLGKWLALALVNLVLLGVIGASTVVLVHWACREDMVIALRERNPATQRMNRAQRRDDARGQVESARMEVLLSRRLFTPRLPDLEEEVRKATERIRATRGPETERWTERRLREFLQHEISRREFAIPFRGVRDFHFEGLPVNAENATLRFRLFGTRPGTSPGILVTGWHLTNPDKAGMPFEHVTAANSGRTEEFRIPGEVIGPDGRMTVSVVNFSGPYLDPPTPPALVYVPVEQGLGVYVPTGTFAANLARGLLLVWVRLLMIAAIGLGANAFLGGSVTAFLLIGVLASGLMSDTVRASLAPRRVRGVEILDQPGVLGKTMDLVLASFPDFGETNPVPDWHAGREIRVARILRQLVYDLLLRGGLFFAAGLFAFRRKEIGLPRLY